MIRIFIYVFCLLFYSLAQAQTITSFGPAQSITVTANLASTGYTIPSDFVGWSGEANDVIAGVYSDTNTSLMNLAHLLSGPSGCGKLRIGGISSDLGTAPALTQSMATHLNAFLNGVWPGCYKLIYGLDLVANNSTLATTQAGYLITAFGVGNVILQNGNEPPESGLSPSTEAQYQTQWNAYYTALHAANASTLFAAPDIGNNQSVQSYVNGLTPGVSGMSYVTTHWYPYGAPYVPTADQLISSVYNNDTPNVQGSFSFQQNVSYATGKLIMTEENTRSSCGQPGVSDRLMASAFELNLMMALANDGWVGTYPHNFFQTTTCIQGSYSYGAYNAFIPQMDGGYSPYPIFYALYLMAQIEGQITATTAVTGPTNMVRAISTVGTGGNANILAQNNNTGFPVSITPTQSAAWTTAKVLLLSGVDCGDANPTLGGQPIQEGGTWTGSFTTINNGASITIPPCGAALVKIQP